MKWILLGLLNMLMVSEVFAASPVYFKENNCICKDGVSVGAGTCIQFCANKQTNGAEILFANFRMNPRNRFKSVNEWCNVARPFRHSNPRCMLEATDENNNVTYLDVTIGRDNVAINLDALAHERTYVIRLLESSTRKKSDAIQIIKFINQ